MTVRAPAASLAALFAGIGSWAGVAAADPVTIVCFRSATLPLLTPSGQATGKTLKAPDTGDGLLADYKFGLIHFQIGRQKFTILADQVRILEANKEVPQAPPAASSIISRLETRGPPSPDSEGSLCDEQK